MQVLKRYQRDKAIQNDIIEKISLFFDRDRSVSFAYLYGSFLKETGFNDIDIAVYSDETGFSKEGALSYQLDLGIRLENVLDKKYPVDCRVLNTAPLSFRFQVITDGESIFSMDESKRVSFEVRTRSLYFDFKPHIEFYYKKAILGR